MADVARRVRCGDGSELTWWWWSWRWQWCCWLERVCWARASTQIAARGSGFPARPSCDADGRAAADDVCEGSGVGCGAAEDAGSDS